MMDGEMTYWRLKVDIIKRYKKGGRKLGEMEANYFYVMTIEALSDARKTLRKFNSL